MKTWQQLVFGFLLIWFGGTVAFIPIIYHFGYLSKERDDLKQTVISHDLKEAAKREQIKKDAEKRNQQLSKAKVKRPTPPTDN